jgi:hypothetical protein
MKSLQLIFFMLLFYLNNAAIYGQNDSLKSADTIVKRQITQTLPDSNKLLFIDSLVRDSLIQDSVKKIMIIPIKSSIDTSTFEQYMQNPYLPMDATPIKMFISFKENQSKDLLFYLAFGNIFLLAFIKLVFPKYFKNLFLLFFQTSLRQKQTREQLLQDWGASLLINTLFLISTGLFITLVIKQQLWSDLSFKNLYAYVVALLMLIYIGKYIFVSFAGWVFNNNVVASSYIFLVLMVNQIMGVLLIPFSIFLAFAQNETNNIVITLSIILIVLLLLYRYFVSFASLRNDLKLNAFHFFLYLCTVEILPSLLLYKLMVNYIG